MDSVPEVVISCQNADGLQRLAEAHVVTQDPMQLVFVQEGQPVHSILKDDAKTHTENTNTKSCSLKYTYSLSTVTAAGFRWTFSPESVKVEWLLTNSSNNGRSI